MKFYPAYLDLRDRPCLVIGGGQVAQRKTLSLLKAGAEVTVVSPALTPKLRDLSVSGKITHLPKDFKEKDLSGSYLVIAATDFPEVNARAARACRKQGILVNAAVPPEESTFIVPSVVERGALVIAVSTSGAGPALSKKIRQELEARYGRGYQVFLRKYAEVRKRVLEEVKDGRKRKRIFQAIVDSDAIRLFGQGKAREAETRMFKLAGLLPRGKTGPGN